MPYKNPEDRRKYNQSPEVKARTKIRNRKYYERNKEKVKQKRKEYYAANTAVILAKEKIKYYQRTEEEKKRHREISRKATARYRERNPAPKKPRQKVTYSGKYNEYYRDELVDAYVVNIIRKTSGLVDIPVEMITAYRELLKLKRLIKQVQK